MAYEFTEEYVVNLRKYIKAIKKYYEEKRIQDIGISKEDKIEVSKFLYEIERNCDEIFRENLKIR